MVSSPKFFDQVRNTCAFSRRASRREYYGFSAVLLIGFFTTYAYFWGPNLFFAASGKLGPVVLLFAYAGLLYVFSSAGVRRNLDLGDLSVPRLLVISFAFVASLFVFMTFTAIFSEQGGDYMLLVGLIGQPAAVIALFIGWLLLNIFFLKPSQPGPNKYGPNPHEVNP
ncbi:DUF805 domain-containing protein [Alisedimentitalea sp. MJ-SS2]|uniref:DUF805 domain-containing protein n=1 Tax=Aliisedimentitalea sp. MJ-SS2 TaxID=3049795 RepID=UPI00290DB3DA|nr:DUF805 domain-containing protein [Alisedimentitalea sp. MJ-SS2]MDU8926149.1 DUF805 domain-containing protein [Alisedimentitalea sp. MJ-SS2]